MNPAILSIGTAVPETVLTQPHARDLFRAQPGTSPLMQRLIGAVFDASEIDTRHTVIEEFARRAQDPRFIDGSPESGRILSPTTAERNALYRREAPRLAIDAATAALEQCPVVDRSEITHVVTVSCTGFFAPGLDVDLVRHLGLAPTTKRLHVGFQGCYAAFPALQHATAVCSSDPDAVVLVVCVELCSLHMRIPHDRDAILTSAVFSDGAAVALVSAKFQGDHARLEIVATETTLTDGSEHMDWDLGNHGFEMILSADVPKMLEATIADALEPLRARHPELVPHTWNDIGWAIHPGGRSILDRVESALELAPERLRASRDVLRHYGNMSSATVLFILQTVLARADAIAPLCAAAFGPGLTIESALLVVHPGAARNRAHTTSSHEGKPSEENPSTENPSSKNPNGDTRGDTT